MTPLRPLLEAFQGRARTIAPARICTAQSGQAHLELTAQLVPRVDLAVHEDRHPAYAWQPLRPEAFDTRDLELPTTQRRCVCVPRVVAEDLETWARQATEPLATQVDLHGLPVVARRTWMASLRLSVHLDGQQHRWIVSELDTDNKPVTISLDTQPNIECAEAELQDGTVVLACIARDGREVAVFRLPT